MVGGTSAGQGWGERYQQSFLARHLIRVSPLLGVLQNDMAPTIVNNSPLFDLFERSKAAEAGKVIVQAAISYARGLNGGVDITHLHARNCEAPNLITQAKGNPGVHHNVSDMVEVSTAPGETALTRMPREPSAAAKCLAG